MTVDTERMRRNLEATNGLILAEAVMMALAEQIGRGTAHDLVHEVSDRALEEGRLLGDVLTEMGEVRKHLDDAAIRRLTDPANYVGESAAVVDRVTRRAEEVLSG
jgi:3-carboxy-cis,cis-muconate cycloisomerase